MSDDKYAVVFRGKPAYWLNKGLADRQKLTDSELEDLKQLHIAKLELFESATAAASTNDAVSLIKYAEALEKIEYGMQRTWHFTEDRNFHEWYLLPGCTCPKMDNAGNKGVDRRIVVRNCPAHGF